MVGTAAYMSPEQVEGKKIDARSDIFSFGSVLYEMVTGRKPFTGESRLAILTKILNEDPAPPSQLASSITPELEKTILRCLRKDPARRHQTMADLKVAVEDLEAESASGRMPDRRRRRRGGAGPGLRCCRWLLAAAYFAWRAFRATSPLGTAPGGCAHHVSRRGTLSLVFPDGNHVAFTWTGPKQDNTDIYVQQIGSGSPLRLTTDPRTDYNPVWSPDGRWIAFLRGESSSSAVEQERIAADPPSGRAGAQTGRDPGARGLHYSAVPRLVSGQQLSGRHGFPGRGKAGRLVRGFARNRGEKAVDQSSASGARRQQPSGLSRRPFARFPAQRCRDAGELYWLPLGKGLTADGEPSRLTLAALNASLPGVDAQRQRNSLFRQGKSLEAGRPRRNPAGATPFRGRGRADAGGLAAPARPAAKAGLCSQLR